MGYNGQVIIGLCVNSIKDVITLYKRLGKVVTEKDFKVFIDDDAETMNLDIILPDGTKHLFEPFFDKEGWECYNYDQDFDFKCVTFGVSVADEGNKFCSIDKAKNLLDYINTKVSNVGIYAFSEHD